MPISTKLSLSELKVEVEYFFFVPFNSKVVVIVNGIEREKKETYNIQLLNVDISRTDFTTLFIQNLTLKALQIKKMNSKKSEQRKKSHNNLTTSVMNTNHFFLRV